MSTNYFNARQVLPETIIEQILTYLPADRRERVLLYIHSDYYADRNVRVVAAFRDAWAAGTFRRKTKLYEALGEQFALSPRRICSILREAGTDAPRPTALAGGHPPAERPRRMRRVAHTNPSALTFGACSISPNAPSSSAASRWNLKIPGAAPISS